MHRFRFLIAAALLAVLFCLFPIRADAPEQPPQETRAQALSPGTPAGADLSEKTEAGCLLHRTLYYAPCGHSIQRRENLPAALIGLSRKALEAEIGRLIPGAAVTGFSAREVDLSVRTDIPCPLHWVLKTGEDNRLHILQNRTGETLEAVRDPEISLTAVPETERPALAVGLIFDDVQQLEGYLESLAS